MASPLPDDILIEIFTRLPAKSVGRFRSLSKPWNSRLSTSQFVKSHLDRRKHHLRSLILARWTDHIEIVTPPITDDVPSKSTVSDYHEDEPHVRVFGSCNGLVLMGYTGYVMYVLNPIIEECETIPYPPFNSKETITYPPPDEFDFDHEFMFYGFGYDSCSDDYKIVVGFNYSVDGENRENHSIPLCAFFQVYSLKLGVWRDITSPYFHVDSVFSYGAFVNGAIHWLAADRKEQGYAASRILAFSLADEVFHEIPTPPDVHVDRSLFNSLSELQGYLCMISREDSHCIGCIGVWVMKEYGSVDSWIRTYVYTRNKWDMKIPLCFTDNAEIVFINKDNVLAMYHVEKQMTKDIAVNGRLDVFYGGGAFVDSLVSPKLRTAVTGEQKR